MKNTITLYVMLSFSALSGNLAAQTKTDYKVVKICSDSLAVTEGFRTDTMSIEQAVRINSSYPIEKELERNRVIFREVSKKIDL